MESVDLSFVSPVYQAKNTLKGLVTRISQTAQSTNYSFEIILVDDGSTDESWNEIKSIKSEFSFVKGVKLSRNFGQHPAIMAGLNLAKGQYVVVMDCDLQDVPEECTRLLFELEKGYDYVLARRIKRRDTFLKRLSSKLFGIVFGFLTGTKFDNKIANYGVYRKKVIQAILEIKDAHKFFPLFVNLVGFKGSTINVQHDNRQDGKTTYGLYKLLKLAFNSMVAYSTRLLKLFVVIGLLISTLSFILGLYYWFQFLNGHIQIMGYTSLIISIWFLSGVIITIIGVVGIYIGKIFEQTKGRPTYIIDEIF